jgi:ABC-type multidrug transport system fused ATPase/permease subunit
MSWFDSTPIGRILNRFGFDTMQMDQYLPMFGQFWSLSAGTTVVTIFLSSVFVPPSIILSVALLVFFSLLYMRYGEISVELQRLNMMSIGPLTGAFSGFLGALDTIRAFDRVQLFVDRFVGYQRDFITTFYWQYTLDRAVQLIVMAPLVTIFVTTISVLLIAFSQSSGYLGELVTPARAGMIVAFANQLGLLFPLTVMLTARLEQSMVATQRVNEYKTMKWEAGAIQKVKRPSGKAIEPDSQWLMHGELKMSDISMRYNEDLPLVLNGVSIDAKPAQKIGIVGRTGSGKSSLVLVVFRMVQADGNVTIDSSDISKMSLPALRGSLGIIPQDCWMFSGTIRNNLDVGGAFTDDQLWDVLRLVQLEDQVKEFENGLEHTVNEKGENMSMGTRQLLCLARVLLKKPKLIFMDEATASVDVKTDMLVQETIRTSFPESTIITIAHRLNTVIDFDRIAVMDAGKLVEFGHPHDLLANEDGYFTKLVHNSGAEQELRQRALAAAGAKPDSASAAPDRGDAISVASI